MMAAVQIAESHAPDLDLKKVRDLEFGFLVDLKARTEMQSKGSLQNGTHASRTSVWTILSWWLSPLDDDSETWWQLTGSHLARMLVEANYSIEKQYEGLLFYRHTVAPRFGSRPVPGVFPEWKCVLNEDASPIEYSWKWNAANTEPEVRYCIEGIGSSAGQATDPLNQEATKNLLYQVHQKFPSLDLTLFHHFSNSFYKTDARNLVNGDAATLSTSMFASFEHLKDALIAKAYFVPYEPKDIERLPMSVFADPVRSLSSGNAALDAVTEFFETDPDGVTLQPEMLSIDCVDPHMSRMKLFARSPRTSFDSVRNVMTLGGKIRGIDSALEELRDLLKLLLGFDEHFSTSEELPRQKFTEADMAHETDPCAGISYYFDVAPRLSLPDVKLYIPVNRYGQNDLQLAQGLGEFLRLRNRGGFVKNYMRVLDGLAVHSPLESGLGVQSYLSCAFENGSLTLTSYLSPRVYTPTKATHA